MFIEKIRSQERKEKHFGKILILVLSAFINWNYCICNLADPEHRFINWDGSFLTSYLWIWRTLAFSSHNCLTHVCSVIKEPLESVVMHSSRVSPKTTRSRLTYNWGAAITRWLLSELFENYFEDYMWLFFWQSTYQKSSSSVPAIPHIRQHFRWKSVEQSTPSIGSVAK